MENSTAKPFYNTTIPSDWDVKILGEITKFSQGVQVDLEKQLTEWQPGYLKFLRIENYTQSSNDYRYIPGQAGRDKYINIDDIAIVRYGATAGFIGSGQEGILANNLFKVEPNKKVLDKRFLLFLLTDFRAYKYFQNAMFGGAMPALSFDIVGSYKISLPPLPEQRAIAHVLGLMDSAINQNNQLIAQRELRKKWLMQNLLTGKKRLKGFDGEWKVIHIKDVSKEVSIRNKTDKQLTVLSCTKYDGLVESLEYWGRKIFADDISTYKIVPKNHFAYATNHIEEGSIGYQDSFDEALISPMYTVFKTDSSINDLYFYKLLKSHMLIYQYQNRMEGSIDRRGGLRWDAFSIIKIHIPSFEEQTAIAKVLQAADKEIQLLKAKTDKLREQKKGMMQLLLTGKKRLKIENE